MLEYSGRVVRGEGYGRKLGFPTANLDRRQWVRQKLKLRHGVYAGVAVLPSGKEYLAGIVIGPKDGKGLIKIEAHLIRFSGNLYDKKLVLQIQKFIRPYKTFANLVLLKKQIASDLKQTIKILKK
jgi:riboflavin kinase/FMN adenylyltransferase